MRKRATRLAALALAAAMAMTACGGGGSNSANSNTTNNESTNSAENKEAIKDLVTYEAPNRVTSLSCSQPLPTTQSC